MGVEYKLGYTYCLYITQGTKEVTFASEYRLTRPMVSAPAHCVTETALYQDG